MFGPPVGIGLIGLGVLLGPGLIARAPAGGAGEMLLARLRDQVTMTVGLGVESKGLGGEIRIVAPLRELDVRNEAGDRFPHHASRPFLWTASVVASPGTRLRPFVAAGVGGMLVSADLDNTDGATLYHPWHWSVGAGVRFDLGRSDPRAGATVLELRVSRARLEPGGPFLRGDATTVTLALGLRL